MKPELIEGLRKLHEHHIAGVEFASGVIERMEKKGPLNPGNEWSRIRFDKTLQNNKNLLQAQQEKVNLLDDVLKELSE